MGSGDNAFGRQKNTEQDKMTSRADLRAPSVAGSTINVRAHQNKVAPNGMVIKQQSQLLGKRPRKRRLSASSSVNLEVEKNPSWIRKNIRMRECIRFTWAPPPKGKPPPSKHDDPKCQCGKLRSKHDERYLNNPDPKAKWKVETHTHTSSTNAYGEIEFRGAAGSGFVKARKYVRVEHNTATNRILHLLNQQWNLGTPKLLISVTGGARNFPLNSRLKDVFRKGLIKAALSTGAWIITGGTHAGVMKYVGEAVRDYALASGTTGRTNVIAIGIASWGVLDQREALISPQGCFPAIYRMDTKKPKGPLLDPNHTHFILVDNGTDGSFGVEIKLRSRVEKGISEERLTGNADVSIPAVCIVVEGGPNTIATVNEAIMNNTPAVIVAGSGRAANILAFAFQRAPLVEVKIKGRDGNIITQQKPKITDALKVRIASMLQQEFGEKDLDIHLNRIQACLQKRHLITVYELDSVGGMDIDGAILHALLKANVGRIQDQLNLALVWNRVDVAKRELFTDDKHWKKGELDGAFHYALVNNQVDFVRLFLEHGISLRDFLTVKELTRLYNEIKPNSLLYELLEKERGKVKSNRKFNLCDVGHVIQELTMDTYEALYLTMVDNDYKYFLTDDELNKSDDEDDDEKEDNDDETEGYNVADGMAQATNNIMLEAGFKQGFLSQDAYHYKHFEEPMRELFVFAILLNRTEMARLFWEESKEAIASALVASKILKTMAEKAGEDSDLGKELGTHASSYEEMAIGVLNECFNEDEERTALILVRELRNWGNQTCLNLAVNADNKNFIAHSGVQNLLTEIWMGKLSNENQYWMLWMCTFLPFLIPCVVKFREDESDETVVEEVRNPDGSVTSLRRKSLSAVKAKQYQNLEEADIQGNQLGESLHMVTVQNGGGGGDASPRLPPKAPIVKVPHTQHSHSVSQASLLGIGEDYYEATFNVDIVDSGKDLSWWQRIVLFYDSPMITFRHNVLAYLIFLALYSYVILSNFHQTISAVEIVVVFWVFTLFLEEFRQIAQGESNSWKIRCMEWIMDYWNIADFATLVLFFTGFILRLFPSTVDEARVLLSLDLAIFFIRVLHIFSIFKNLGPKLIMIGRMMVDLLFFICILFVFLIAYGIAAQAIMFPNTTSFRDVIRGVIFRSYFQMYGELFLEEIQGDSCNATALPGSTDACPEYTGVGIVLLSFYMLLSNILLLNLLIAMFSYTFSAIQDHTDIYWKYQRYGLIKEYFSRPPLVPPFIIFSHMFFLGRFTIQTCCHKLLNSRAGEMKQILPENEVSQLVKWEVIKSDDYIADEKRRHQEEIHHRVGHTKDRVEDLLQKIEKIFADPETGAPSRALGLLGEKALENRLNRLEDQMERTNQAIDWIISSLAENRLGHKEGLPELKAIEPREEPEDLSAMTEDERKVPTSIEELGIAIHVKARTSPYPNTAIRRFPVPDEKVPWENVFTHYKPISYTHSSILAMPHFADVDLISQPKSKRQILNFNAEDRECKYDRRSYMGNYNVQDGLPMNPKGRTGIIGRGILGRFGPNHAADPVVTRWKRTPEGNIMADETGKRVLEYVAIQRRDNSQWAIPGGMVEPGDQVSYTLKREFGEEALGEMDKNEEEKKKIGEAIEKLFASGVEVYRGYVDDPRNTDHAWMETVCMNFHDEEGSSVGQLPLQAGDDAQGVRWQRVSSKIPLFASHAAMLKKVAELHEAAF